MWGQFNSLTKLVSEQAGSVIKEAGLDATLNTAKQQLTGQLDKFASSVLVIEPGQPSKAAGFVVGNGDSSHEPAALRQESVSLSQLREENARLQRQFTQLQETAADVLGELEEAQDALAREQAARTAAELRLEEALQTQRTAATQSLTQKDELQKLKDALSANEANAKAMETKGRRQYNQLMAAKEQLMALQATDEELRKQNSELQGVQQQLTLELEALRSHCKKEQDTEGTSSASLKQLSDQLLELRAQLQERDERLSHMEAQVQQQQQHGEEEAVAVAAREASLIHAAAEASARAAEAEAVALALRPQLDEALATLREADTRAQQAATESVRLAAELACHSLRWAEREAAADLAVEALAEAKQQAEARATEVKQMRVELARQQDATQDHVTALERQRKREADAEASRADAERREVAAVSALERLKQRMATEEMRHRHEVDELNDSLDNLRRRLDEQERGAAAGNAFAQQFAVHVMQLESSAALYDSVAASHAASYGKALAELQERLTALQHEAGTAAPAAQLAHSTTVATAVVATAPAARDGQVKEGQELELALLRAELLQLRHSSEAATQLRKQLAVCDGEMYDMRQRITRADEERASLEERLQRLQRQLREAREARDVYGAEAEEERRQLQAELTALGQRLRELEMQLAAAAAAATESERRATEVEVLAAAAAEEAATVAAALAARADSAEAHVRQLQSEVDSAAAELSAVSSEAEKRSLQLSMEKIRLEEEVARGLAALMEAQVHMGTLEVERARLEEEATRGSVALSEAQARVEALEGTRWKLEESCAALQSRADALEAEAVELRRQVGAGVDASKAATEVLEAAQSCASHLRMRVSELEQQLFERSQALQVSERMLAQAEDDLRIRQSELVEARDQLKAAEAKLERFTRELAEKAAALEAVRSGSQAELALAAQRLVTAASRTAELDAALAAMEATNNEATAVLQHKLTAMEKEAVSAQIAARQFERQVSVLRDSLTAERDSAAAALAVVRSEAQAKAGAELAEATSVLAKQWQSRLDKAAAGHSAVLQETQQELEALRQRAKAAEQELAVLQAASGDMDRLRKVVADFGPLTARLEADKEAARQAAQSAQAAQQQLEERVRCMEAEVTERNRRFQMLQRSFKGDLESARQQLEVIQAQITSHIAAEAEAEQRAAEATARCQAAEVERAALQQQLEDAHAAAARLEASLAAQIAAGAEVAGRLAGVEAMLAEERAGQAAAQSDGELLRQDFERIVTAAVAAREEEAERRVAVAVAREEEALAVAQQAEARAEAAEMAKIELTLALARVDDEGRAAASAAASSRSHATNLIVTRSGDYGNFSGGSHGGAVSTSGDDLSAASPDGASHGRRLAARQAELHADMQRRVDEAELAAAVQTRRAVGLEAEVSRLQQQLSESQRHAKELSWQISVALGGTPNTTGVRGPLGGSGSGGTASSTSSLGMLDLLGCGANYRRK